MDYLKTTLQFAADNLMSVLIAMHIPLGNNVYDGSFFLEMEYQDMVLDTIAPHFDHIIGILVSHTHMEEFKILRLRYDEGAINIGQYFTAGLSTSHGNSPSIKVFEMDKVLSNCHINQSSGINWPMGQIQRLSIVVYAKLNLNKRVLILQSTTRITCNILLHLQSHFILTRAFQIIPLH